MRRGYTLLEIVVVIATVSVLVALAIPVAIRKIAEARDTRARADVTRLSAAVLGFIKDTGRNPDRKNASGSRTFDLLRSTSDATKDPIDPSGLIATLSANAGDLNDQLVRNTYSYPNWSGPYVQEISLDAFGRNYLVYTKGFHSATTGSVVWIISAGQNQKIETGETDTKTSGDDIGLIFDVRR